ncbi:MAG: flagellar export chaperone FliS [Burkholderiales bacterium]|nr:flagellar export chaperone FliS [Burkholderiales bacterium]
MNTLAARGVDRYARTDLETGVEAASPQRLVIMLYDGAIRAMMQSKAAFASGDVSARGEALSKAIAIIDEGLSAVLDRQIGGDIAENLANLYDYISNRLLYANLKGHEASVDEAMKLMIDLRGAWEQLERDTRRAASPDQKPDPERVPAMSYGRA